VTERGDTRELGDSAGPDVAVLVQSAYYGVTGVWPLISPNTFQAITGPKSEMWLVKTFGVLITVLGLGLGRSAARGRVDPDLRGVAAGAAGALAAADVWYVLRGRIRVTYLGDAAAQLALLAALRGSRR
jgi:hypothetical protein